MTKRMRSIQLALITVLLCITMIAGGTYALFSDQVKLSNHLSAGNLKVSLYRTNLVTKTLDTTTGYLVDGGDDSTVDFTNSTDNVFGIANGTALVPESSYDATMMIKNEGSVAFAYWIEIVFDDSDDLAFADQITITVTIGGKNLSVALSEGLTIGSESAPIGKVTVNASQSFNVKAVFENLATNNDAKGQEVSFDLIVHAVQATKA